ncbi:MAG: hypothetical protein KGM16_08475 [Bacteroidota bacterium]|nr:hypothetical protein [Bacteroidota bacterium]
MSQTMFEKLQLEDEKNLLIQGLPSTIEKQFSKLSFSKNVTQLLKIRKVDFALVFALNSKQLQKIFTELCPALRDETKLWIAFPKQASKIVSDLNRQGSWDFLIELGYETGEKVVLDYVWSAQRFTKAQICEQIKPKATASKVVSMKPASRKFAEAEGF